MILQRWLLTVTPVQGEVDPTAPGALQTVGSNEAGQIGDNTNLDRGEFTNIGALSWKSVATGASHVLALRSDNLLYGWGSNQFGQLGDSSLINRSSPVQIGTSSWNSISTKKNSSFGITADNKLFAWGFSQNGELGNQQRFDPNSFSSVSVAESHGLAIRSADNSLWAWGGNATGQLGDGTTVNKSFLTKIGSDSWLMISAGGANRSFGIKSNYTLWGWGGSYLGDGITVNRSSPVQINPLSGASSWTMVDAGIGTHSAGITTTGELYVWGGASSGQLGDGTTVLKSRATKIGTSSWTTVSCGDNHTLAIRNGGGMFVWGSAAVGRLGLNSTSINRSSPVQIGTSSWIAVSAGEETSVAIRSDNTLWGWGSSTYVGDNTTIARSSPVQIGTSTWSKVSAGSYNTTFAIRSDNTMWAWGRNTDGQFGNNSVVSRSSPVQIGSGTWNVLPRPRQGAVTTSSSISAAIDGNGVLYQWGNNSITQIIDVYSAIQYSSPIQIGLGGYNSPVAIGSSSWTSVSAGTSRTYAIRSDGGLFAWGANDRGQLGDSTEIYRSSPVQIGSSSWHMVSAADTHAIGIDSTRKLHFIAGSVGNGEDGRNLKWTQLAISNQNDTQASQDNPPSFAAIRSDGALFVWGGNWRGQLGDGTTLFKSYPVQLGTSSWTSVSLGDGHMMAIRSDGALFLTGNNEYGALGSNDRVARSSPVQLGSNSWNFVYASHDTSFAIRSDGGLFAWGYDLFGKTGLNSATVNRSSPVQVGTSSWVSVSGGLYWTVAKRSDGAIFTWGNGSLGRLGHGNTINRSSPVQVGTSSWVSVSSGAAHCLAMNASGVLFGWGVGFGDATARSAPTQIFEGSFTMIGASNFGAFSYAKYKTGATPSLNDFTLENQWRVAGANDNGQRGNGGTTGTLSSAGWVTTNEYVWSSVVGASNNAGAITEDGAIYVWGRGRPVGRTFTLGTGDTRGSLVPVQIKYTVTAPVLISSSSWNVVSAGYRHNLALNSANNLFAWGNHSANTSKPAYSWISAAITRVSGSISFRIPSYYAIRSDGALFAWGGGDNGMLGNSSTIPRSSPVQIGTSSWSMVSTCLGGAFAIRSDGALFSWGYGANAALGGNSTVSRSSPVQIGASSWSMVASCAGTTVWAITSDNRLFAWGNNNSGQVGDGTTINRSSPVQIGSGFTFAAVGGATGFAIKNDGSLWGSGIGSILGRGVTTNLSTLTQLGSASWAFVSGGASHVLGIRSDNTLWGWGLNASGELGDNTTISRSSPVQIGTSSWSYVHAAVAFDAGFSIGATTDNLLYAWGVNGLGQLGDGTTINRSSPVQIGTGITSSNKTWVDIHSVNFSDSNAVIALSSAGELFGWGNGVYVPLTAGTYLTPAGDVSNQSEQNYIIASKPVQIGLPSTGSLVNYSIWQPTQIGSDSWRIISAGNNSNMGINSANNLYVWGMSSSNDLGTANSYIPAPTLVGGSSFKVGAVDTTESVSAIAKLS